MTMKVLGVVRSMPLVLGVALVGTLLSDFEGATAQSEKGGNESPQRSVVQVQGDPTPTPFPQRGMLARSATSGYNSKAVDSTWGTDGDSPKEREAAPIGGSVSKRSDREWVARLFNNSEDTYNVSVRVIQLNEMGKQEKSDTFGVTLKPKQKYERTVHSTVRTVDAAIELERWKNLSEKSRQADEEKLKTLSGVSPAKSGARSK